jgi:hypothetical protein
MLQEQPGPGRWGMVARQSCLPAAPHPSALTNLAPCEGSSLRCWATAGTEQESFRGPMHPPLRSTDRRGSVDLVGTGKINGAGAGWGGTVTWSDKVPPGDWVPDPGKEPGLTSCSLGWDLAGGSWSQLHWLYCLPGLWPHLVYHRKPREKPLEANLAPSCKTNLFCFSNCPRNSLQKCIDYNIYVCVCVYIHTCVCIYIYTGSHASALPLEPCSSLFVLCFYSFLFLLAY